MSTSWRGAGSPASGKKTKGGKAQEEEEWMVQRATVLTATLESPAYLADNHKLINYVISSAPFNVEVNGVHSD